MKKVSNKRLAEITAKVRATHSEIQIAARKTLEQAIEVGGLIAEAHQLVGHGGKRKWEQSVGLKNSKTANNYVRLYQMKDKIDPKWSLTEAYKKLWEEDQKNKPNKPKKTLKQQLGITDEEVEAAETEVIKSTRDVFDVQVAGKVVKINLLKKACLQSIIAGLETPDVLQLMEKEKEFEIHVKAA